ncbi:MAG: MBL fold metallo-hydrolase [Candidatus Thorarchaeota archaeon]
MQNSKSQIQLTFLGGVDEVGGNIVLLEDLEINVNIFLDFGINIKKFKNNYDLNEHPNSIEELIILGLLPNEKFIPIKNLYTKQVGIHRQKKSDQDLPSNLDAVLISHPHKDHFLGLSFINRTIPIYTGVVTKKIIKAFYRSARRTIDNNFKGLNWQTFRTGDVLNIKGLRIVPFHVDHSIPAAYGFIIYSSAGPIVYTGDLRMHGPLSHMTEEFLEEIGSNNLIKSEGNVTQEQVDLISKGVKILICEGTKINKGVVESEEAVKANLSRLFKKNPFDYILVKYDRIDWDRFRTFSHIAKEHDWKYIISERDAYFYYLLNKGAIYETMKDPNIIEDEHIYILKTGLIKFAWQEKIRNAIYTQNQSERFLEHHQIKDLDKNYFIFITHLYDRLMNNLNLNLKGLFISSSIDPYVEEFYDNTNKICNKLLEIGIPAYRIHASGHATSHDLINFINQVKPEILIPVHTDHTDFFKKFFQNSAIEVIIPELHKIIEL